MFGHEWESAEATIVARNGKSTSGDGAVTIYEYIADITPASGPPVRMILEEPGIATNFWQPDTGDRCTVLLDAKRGKVKFDKDDPRVNAKARMATQQSGFDAMKNRPPGS